MPLTKNYNRKDTMKDNLNEDLKNLYPWLKQTDELSVPDGWVDLFKKFCSELNNALIKYALVDQYSPIIISPISGLFIIYAAGGNAETKQIEKKYCFESLLYCPICGKHPTKYKVLSGDLEDLNICEDCQKIFKYDVRLLTWADIPLDTVVFSKNFSSEHDYENAIKIPDDPEFFTWIPTHLEVNK